MPATRAISTGCNDLLSITQPEAIARIHRGYLEAGADIISTNTFNANRVSMADYDLSGQVRAINLAGVACARKAVDEFLAAGQRDNAAGPFVAGSIGPTNRTASLSPDVNNPGYRAVDFDRLVAAYCEQAEALLDGGADILLVETVFDTLNLKACLFAIEDLFAARRTRLPVMVSVTITDRSGRTLSGQTLAAFLASIEHADLLSVGINCALGPSLMRPYIEELSQLCPVWTSCHPNAGLPNEFGGYDETPEQIAAVLGEFAANGWVNIVGGCCGTTPAHIRAIAACMSGKPPRRPPPPGHDTLLSGLEPLAIRPDSTFIMIGERTNVSGSKKFARLVRDGKLAEAVSVARQQVEGGANIIDVNMDEGLLDGPKVMTEFLNLLAAEPDIARVPVMIDSSNWAVIEAGLKCVQGKSIVNSISLKEGEEQFLAHARLVRRYGAACVVMMFDEEGQAVTVEHKIRIARRAYKLLTEKAGMKPADIIFDPNILAIGTGIEEHARYAIHFIEAARKIKELLPDVKISGGVSNVSFAFRGNDAVREAFNAAFLYHAIHAGLDMGIVNAGQLAVYEDIEPALRQRVEDVIFDRRPDATERLVACGAALLTKAPGRRRGEGRSRLAARHGRGAAEACARARHRRLYRCRRGGGAAELRRVPGHHRGAADGRHPGRRRPVRRRQDVPPPGRQERPRDEEGGGLPHALHGGTEAAQRRNRGGRAGHPRHDRPGHRQGRCPRHRQEHRRHRAGLQQLQDHRPGRDGPLREDPGNGPAVEGRHDRPERADHAKPGGDGPRRPRNAAVEDGSPLVDRRGHHEPQAYGREDRPGLCPRSCPREGRLALRTDLRAVAFSAEAGGVRRRKPRLPGADGRLVPAETRVETRLLPRGRRWPFSNGLGRAGYPRAAFLGVRTLADYPLEELVPYIDWAQFFAAWEMRGKFPEILEHPQRGAEARKLYDDARKFLDAILEHRWLRANGVYAFWPAASSGDDIILYEDDSRGDEKARLHFLRQQWLSETRRCYYSNADFIAPVESGRKDYMGGFAVTGGLGADELVRRCEADHDDYAAIMAKVFADRLAEAFAERLHEIARRDWGYGRGENLSVADMLAEKYRGVRPAPGYPSLPDHTEKRTLFDLWGAERSAGIELTESFMMLPAGSVSGFYFAHPDSRYFAVDRVTRDQVEDYARRKGWRLKEAEKWLAPVLAYDPE